MPFAKPVFVQSSDGKLTGKVVGGGRFCSLEGCGGWRYPVRWPDGKLTWPCSKGMTAVDTETWRIDAGGS